MNTIQNLLLCGSLTSLCLFWPGGAGLLAGETNPPAAKTNVEELDAAETARRQAGWEGSFGGIGAELVKTNGLIMLRNVIASGPAERAGIKAGSEVRSINAIPTKSMALDDAVKLLRGPMGTKVEVEIAPPNGAPQRISLTRDKVVFSNVEYRALDGDLVYLRIRGFNKATPDAARQALSRHGDPQPQGVVLDLRDESGGMLDAIAEVAGFFVGRDKTLWLFESVAGRVSDAKSQSPAVTDLPLVVLVNGQTRSGELIAAAMQRNRRGTVVGQRTSGSSASRNLVKNPDGTSRLVPAGTFLASEGRPITGVGVTPDRLLPETASDEDFLKAARESLLAGNKANGTAAERLQQVKELYDKGLITKEVYEKKRQEILNSL